MSSKIAKISIRYKSALGKHIKRGLRGDLKQAYALGVDAAAIGLEPLTLARIHERLLRSLVVPKDGPKAAIEVARRAAIFFAEAITPMELTHRGAFEANVKLNRVVESLRRRSSDLSAANSDLKQEIVQRKAAEKSLAKSRHHYGELLMESRQMQRELRVLSHQMLSAQEEDRKKISRELHDEIGQVLTSINAGLADLKRDASSSTTHLKKKITSTQRLVEKSVEIVHRFARELRPAALDDLGLIPALHSLLKAFAKPPGIRARLTAFSRVEQMDSVKRTVLYRVAQEALTNVARHARASVVEVTLVEEDGIVCMTITDNGRSFHADRVLHSKMVKRLGLLGMRERVEMVGGTFAIEAKPGSGTAVKARIPFGKIKRTLRPSATSGSTSEKTP